MRRPGSYRQWKTHIKIVILRASRTLAAVPRRQSLYTCTAHGMSLPCASN